MRALLFFTLVTCVYAFENFETQNVKTGVKGGHSSYQYRGGDISRFYGVNNSQSYGGGYNHGITQPPPPPSPNFEVGVCYVEVPTASLVRDPSHIPAGNGSRPDLSRIRTCCKGYKRNPYNFRICDPECTTECINALCTAPDTCTCFPDHVRNLAGICVATCPIGCQNGHCSGGECLCREGYKLDRDGRFCVPSCAAECDRIGNCTAPNTCTCKEGISHPICHSTSQTSGSGQHPVPDPYHPYPGTNKPTQGNTVYNNPNNPSYPYNQNQNNTFIPNPNSSPTTTPNPYGHGSFNQGQVPLPPQTGQRPPYSTYPITYNFTNPYNHPLYPDNQIAPNPLNPSSIHNGQHPQNPTSNPFSQNTVRPNQDTVYSHYPSVQTVNVSIPSQYPLYPSNQIGPNSNTNQGINPNLPSNPNHPSDNQGPLYPYNQNGYPYNQSGYPYNLQNANQPQPGGFYNQNRPSAPTPSSTYPQNPGSYPYPSYPYSGQQNSPYGQHSYGTNSLDQNSYQTQDLSSSPSCSGPCINGACAENNLCKCYPGYIMDEDDTTGRRCRPHCPGGCPNGYCASPYSCACDEGYYKDTSVKGRALCIKRIRRSADEEKPINVAELLTFEIPDYNEN